MIFNYLRIAFRNLLRQKGYSFINILGLTLGLATALFIFIWVYDECTYDRFHEQLDQIYRVEQEQDYNGRIFHVNVTSCVAGPGWNEEIPEITHAVRFSYSGNLLCQYGEKRFYESGIVSTDSCIFEVFTFPLRYGDPKTALNEPNSIVLTAEMATKYFGDQNPLGEVIVVDNQHNMTVKGVLEEIPRNSSIGFDFLVPYTFAENSSFYNDSWSSNSIQTYVMLNPNSDPAPVDDKLTQTVIKHIDWSVRANGPESYTTKFMLAPMRRMHLHSFFGFNHTHQNFRSLIIMSIIGLFVLLIAVINYMNLATARSARRAREIGLRKVSGGNRGQIIRQFFAESIITSLLAMFLAAILVLLLMDSFQLISGKEIDPAILLTLPFVLGMLLIAVLTGVIAGIYPALFLSAFKPVKVLYGDPSDRGSKGLLRKVLVILQFSISLLLIISTTAVFLQNKYLSDFDRGYNADNLLYIQLFGDMNQQYDVIRNAFEQLPEVERVSGSMHPPGRIGSNGGGIQWDGMPEDLDPLVSQAGIDFDYVEVMGLEVVEGRSFSRDFPSDLASDSTGGFMINETMARIINREDLIGFSIRNMGVEAPIIGILKDYNFTSLQDEIPPLNFIAIPPSYIRFIDIRLKPGDTEKALDKLEQEWNQIMPDFPFSYRFVQDDLDAQNRDGRRMGKLLLAFTIIAILIACLGLLGLSAFMAEKRTREFGIRKTLGASMPGIVVLMLRQFSVLILISMVIAIPVAYYFLNQLLQDFANRIDLSWLIFFLPALLILGLALTTVSFYAIRAARTNPAVCLHYE